MLISRITSQDGQNGQAYITAPNDTQVDFEGTVHSDEGTRRMLPLNVVTVESSKVIQTVSMNGKVVSQESDDLDSDLLYLYSGNECYTGSGNCGILAGYIYENITVHLNAADEKYGKTLNLYSGSSSSGFSTADNGKTWHAESVNIAEDEFSSA